jgi:hypothetical protein
MTFKEIANRITGFSFPIFGMSWTPPALEIEIARKTIIFLEDRRVLYVVYELESPMHCVSSINIIRDFLTEQISSLGNETELSHTLRAMRATCRRFLNTIQEQYYFERMSRDFGTSEQIHFYNAMGELRATMGTLIAKVLVMHGLDCESDLLSIIPMQLLDD